MPLTDDGYEPRDADTIAESEIDTLEELFDNPATNEGRILRALLDTIAETLHEQQEQSLSDLYDAAYLETAEGIDLTRKAREIGIERRSAVAATGVVEFSRGDAAPSDFVIQSGTTITTDGSDRIEFETTESVTLAEGTTSVKATVEAVEGGSNGNIGADRLTVLPSPPTGVETVTNPNPIGDDDYTDTDGNPLVIGRDRESDPELRERAFQSTSIGGAATASAVGTALREENPSIESITLYQNPNDTEDSDGLPPYSVEFVIYGGALSDIADTIYNSIAITELGRLEGGIHGTKETYTLQSNIISEDITIAISRPTEVGLSLTIDLVHGNNYVGDTEIKNRIVEYIGGTRSDGSSVMGTNAGENVYLDTIEDVVVDDDTDVIGISDMLIDRDGDGTDDRTTDSNGLEIISIADSDVASIDASNITINSTEQ